MTAKYRNPARCKRCGEVLECLCGRVHTDTTPFSDWIREVLDDSDTYDVQNIDFVRFHYREGWFITIEEKQHGKESSSAQRDTQSILAQMLTASSGRTVKTWRGDRPIVYKGHFVVSFENTNPSDSDWVIINGVAYGDPEMVVTRLLKAGEPEEKSRESLLDFLIRESEV